MEILYIWDGRNSLPESRRAAISATMDLYPDARLSCITRLKHFISSQFKIINWDDILFQMSDHFGFKQTPYTWHDPRTFSDWARFWYLGLHGETLYLDTDARMVERYPFEEEFKVIYSPGNICLLYSPKGFKRENFLALQEKQIQKHVGQLMGLHAQFNPSWSKPIPQSAFRHH